MIHFIRIYTKYIFHKNYQAHKLLKDILYIPIALGRERINLTDDIQLPGATIEEASLG